MPRKTEDLAFLKNQLRVFIMAKRTNSWSPGPALKLRAMYMLGVLNGAFKDEEPEIEMPEAPKTAVVNDQLQGMLDRANKLKGGVNADKLS